MLTGVSKSASSSPFTNPVMVYVSVGSVAPYTFVCPVLAVTVKLPGVIAKFAPVLVML